MSPSAEPDPDQRGIVCRVSSHSCRQVAVEHFQGRSADTKQTAGVAVGRVEEYRCIQGPSFKWVCLLMPVQRRIERKGRIRRHGCPPGPPKGRALRYRSPGRPTKPTPPCSCGLAAKVPLRALGMACGSRGAPPLLDSQAPPLSPCLCESSTLRSLRSGPRRPASEWLICV